MNNKLLRALIFLRIVNGDNNISLTNLSLIAIMVKVCLEPSIDLAAAATLLTVISGYHVKRYINNKS